MGDEVLLYRTLWSVTVQNDESNVPTCHIPQVWTRAGDDGDEGHFPFRTNAISPLDCMVQCWQRVLPSCRLLS